MLATLFSCSHLNPESMSLVAAPLSPECVLLMKRDTSSAGWAISLPADWAWLLPQHNSRLCSLQAPERERGREPAHRLTTTLHVDIGFFFPSVFSVGLIFLHNKLPSNLILDQTHYLCFEKLWPKWIWQDWG